MSGTFGRCPKKARPRALKGFIMVELRDSIVAPWKAPVALRPTQDAEGTLAVKLPDDPRRGIYHATMYYPKALWRLA